MNADQILTEIREANLSYLMLAQSLIRSDREQALFRLGISEESASMIALLTPAQMMKVASGNTLLCRFRMDDDLVWGLGLGCNGLVDVRLDRRPGQRERTACPRLELGPLGGVLARVGDKRRSQRPGVAGGQHIRHARREAAPLEQLGGALRGRLTRSTASSSRTIRVKPA